MWQSVLITSLFCFSEGLSGLLDGYSYPIPQQPPQFDEPTLTPTPIYIPAPQPSPTYLPPQYPPIGLPPVEDEILPPFDDTIVIPGPPANQYLPPPNPIQYLPPVLTRQAPLHILNMSCLNSKEGFFRTTLRSTNGLFPAMEASGVDCAVTTVSSDTFRIDLDGQRVSDCGVRTCGTRVCLVLRMATVRGLRLVDDPLVTLQCIPQEAVVSNTKHLRLSTNSEQGRAVSRSVAVAAGGSQKRFETQMSLLRKSGGGDVFDQAVQQGSAVRLGDELLLRTLVRDGDGWKYSRMGAVIVRSAASQRSVILVDEEGCRSPTMKSVCPQQPQQISPLVIQLPFRAFLFQGAAPADDLLLSVRMIGCLRARDCYQTKVCEDGTRSRVSRSAKNTTTDEPEIITNLDSEFQFRVLPRDVPLEAERHSFHTVNPLFLMLFIVSIIVMGFVTICAVKNAKSRPHL